MPQRIPRLCIGESVGLRVGRSITLMLAKGVLLEERKSKNILKISHLVLPARVSHKLFALASADVSSVLSSGSGLKKPKNRTVSLYGLSSDGRPPALICRLRGVELFFMGRLIRTTNVSGFEIDKNGMTIIEKAELSFSTMVAGPELGATTDVG